MGPERWETTNDVVWSVAKLARELADEKMDDLRLRATQSYGGEVSVNSVREEFRGFSRGDLIEVILTGEEEGLIVDFPRDIE